MTPNIKTAWENIMIDEDDIDSTQCTCPMCEQSQNFGSALLGQLAQATYLRCVFCGWEWYIPVACDDNPEEQVL